MPKPRKHAKAPPLDLDHLEVDGDRPLLDQLEEAVLNAREEEFTAGLRWLEENVYSHPDRLEILSPMLPAPLEPPEP